MKLTLKGKKISPMNILIDFFAFQYDMVYYFFKFLLETIIKFALKIKKIAPMNILIVFFAFQYDLVYDFIIFLGEYVKWITHTNSIKSHDFVTHTDQLIQIRSQNTYEFR
jgi:hypothetical protein